MQTWGVNCKKYFASKTCLISFLKPFQWRWNCLVSVYYLTPGGFHNGHQNRSVVTDTSWSLFTLGDPVTITTAESFLHFFSDVWPGYSWCQWWGWVITLSFLICQFKCGLRSHKLCSVCLTGEKKVLKITPCSPEFIGYVGETVSIYCIFFIPIFRLILCWSFSKLEVISGVFFYIFSLCLLLSFSYLLSNIIILYFRCLLHFSSPFYKYYTHAGILVFDDLADRTEHAE